MLDVPYFEQQPNFGFAETRMINQDLAEIFQGADFFHHVPDNMLMRPHKPDDFAHYTFESAELLVKFIQSILALN